MTETIFKTDAKGITDTLFQSGLFRDDVTRDQMDAIETLIEFMLSSRFHSYQKSLEIRRKYENLTPQS